MHRKEPEKKEKSGKLEPIEEWKYHNEIPPYEKVTFKPAHNPLEHSTLLNIGKYWILQDV